MTLDEYLHDIACRMSSGDVVLRREERLFFNYGKAPGHPSRLADILRRCSRRFFLAPEDREAIMLRYCDKHRYSTSLMRNFERVWDHVFIDEYDGLVPSRFHAELDAARGVMGTPPVVDLPLDCKTRKCWFCNEWTDHHRHCGKPLCRKVNAYWFVRNNPMGNHSVPLTAPRGEARGAWLLAEFVRRMTTGNSRGRAEATKRFVKRSRRRSFNKQTTGDRNAYRT